MGKPRRFRGAQSAFGAWGSSKALATDFAMAWSQSSCAFGGQQSGPKFLGIIDFKSFLDGIFPNKNHPAILRLLHFWKPIITHH